MACYDTGDYSCTYDSGGGKDYSVLATWEAASDNDLSSTGITPLDCYDSQDHDDSVTVSGATNTDRTHRREIRSASGCTTPWAGKAGTGAKFDYTASSSESCLLIEEDFARARDIEVQMTSNFSATATVAGIMISGCTGAIALNCVVHDCVNNGSGSKVNGIVIYPTGALQFNLAYNCIIYNNSGNGIYLANWVFSIRFAAICCTSVGNSYRGIYSVQGDSALPCVFSCYAANNGTVDFYSNTGSYGSASGWNSSKDTSSSSVDSTNYKNSNDLITGGELDSDYLPTQHIYWAGGSGNNAGRNPYNDVPDEVLGAADAKDFWEFLKADAWGGESAVPGEAISRKDIRGTDRYAPTTADVVWDVGAGEYYVPGSRTPKNTRLFSLGDRAGMGFMMNGCRPCK